MDEAYLCLKCRGEGHTVQKCPKPWPWISGSHKWAFSDKRISTLNELRPAELSELCQELDILSMFEGDLKWKTPHSLRISTLRGNQHYRSLGAVGKVVFQKDCPLCVCIFACAPNPRSWRDEVHIVAEWSIHRLERLVHVDSDSRPRYDKCLLVDVMSSDGTFAIDEHHGDAIGILREESLPLSPRRIDPQHVDIEFIQRCLSLCQQNHSATCVPHRNGELRYIHLIDVETRTLVPYSIQNV